MQVAMQEREYGVGLKFLPRVLPGGMIELHVTPEVSELTSTGTTISNGQINSVLPTFTTRRTATTVMLQDGQSFAIGGLTKNSLNSTASQVPGLADIPVLGALFRSTSFQNDLSELVFVVTVRLVQPQTLPPPLPTQTVEPASRAQRIWEGQLESPASAGGPAAAR
jgi:pilus assembly protein CpaC